VLAQQPTKKNKMTKAEQILNAAIRQQRIKLRPLNNQTDTFTVTLIDEYEAQKYLLKIFLLLFTLAFTASIM